MDVTYSPGDVVQTGHAVDPNRTIYTVAEAPAEVGPDVPENALWLLWPDGTLAWTTPECVRPFDPNAPEFHSWARARVERRMAELRVAASELALAADDLITDERTTHLPFEVSSVIVCGLSEIREALLTAGDHVIDAHRATSTLPEGQHP